MLYFILICGVLVRGFGVFRPLLGNFATKNVVYAMIAKNFISNPSTFFRPTLDVLRNGQKSLHMTEWPFFSYFVGAIHKSTSYLGLDATGRLLNIVLFTFSGVFVYLFVKDIWSKKEGLIAVFFYMFFPLGIVYGQSFQLESSIALCIAAIFYLINSWVEGRKSVLHLVFLWITINILLLMKIQMLYLSMPALFLLVSTMQGRQVLKKPIFYLFCLSCLVIPVAWYKYTYIVANGYDNVFFSILYSTKIRIFPDPRIFTAEFYCKILYLIVKNVFSPLGAVLVFIGIIIFLKEKGRKAGFVLAYLFATFIYFLLMPRKVFEMDYYYIPLLLPGAIAATRGISAITVMWVKRTVLFFFLTISIVVAWNPAYKTTKNEIVFTEAGKYIDSYLPLDAKVIVCSQGSPLAFLYYMNRTGVILPISEVKYPERERDAREELNLLLETSPERLFDEYRNQGAQYFVCDNEEWLKSKNPELYDYIISDKELHRNGNILVVDLIGIKE